MLYNIIRGYICKEKKRNYIFIYKLFILLGVYRKGKD